MKISIKKKDEKVHILLRRMREAAALAYTDANQKVQSGTSIVQKTYDQSKRPSVAERST